MPSLVIPVSSFPRGAARILVKARPILSATSRKAFGQVGTDRTRCAVQLVRESESPPVLSQLCDVVPSEVREEQSESIGLHVPEPIRTENFRHASQPLLPRHHSLRSCHA